MGTDIHMVAQVRREGVWETVRGLNGSRHKHELEAKEKGEPLDPYWQNEPELTAAVTDVCDLWRNYDAFAMFAGVRNGLGFAACVTGDGFHPIDNPRGLPDDFEAVDDVHAEVWMGDHSHTWLTLRELQEYAWDSVTNKCGWVNGPQRREMLEKELSAPDSYCGGVSGPSITHTTLQLLDQRLKDGEECASVYAEAIWPVTYREAAGQYVTELVPWLESLGAPDDVRIVMGFDS